MWTAVGAGMAPPVESGVTAGVRLTWIPATRQLRYAATVYGAPAGDVLSTHLHRGAPGEVGPVLLALSGPGAARAAGTLTLTAAERDALESGVLYFAVHTRQHRNGAARVQIDWPARRRAVTDRAPAGVVSFVLDHAGRRFDRPCTNRIPARPELPCPDATSSSRVSRR